MNDMAQFEITEGSRAGSITEFGRKIEQMKRYQRVYNALNDIEPLIDELYDNLNLFDSHDDLHDAIVTFYIGVVTGKRIIEEKAEYLKKEIEIEN